MKSTLFNGHSKHRQYSPIGLSLGSLVPLVGKIETFGLAEGLYPPVGCVLVTTIDGMLLGNEVAFDECDDGI